MSESKQVGGNWFGPVLFLVFMTLKLCSVIDWSWWWVSAPLWVSFICGLTANTLRELRAQKEARKWLPK